MSSIFANTSVQSIEVGPSYCPSQFSRLYPSQLSVSSICRGRNHKVFPRLLYSRQKYLRFNPICLATGTPDRDNWAFTSPYDVLKEQMRNHETGGSGGPPRRGGGGGGRRNGDNFGGNDDEDSSENVDEMIQVTLATIGFVVVYGYLMRGAELTRLGRDYIIYLVKGTASARLLREKEKWVNLYEDLTRTFEIPKVLLHQIVLYSIAFLQNPKKLVLIK